MINGTYIIGVGHKARQGKDTYAYFLRRELMLLGRDAEIYGFADDLKAYCRVEYGMDTKDPALLIKVGDEKRQEDEDFWVKRLLWRIRCNKEPGRLEFVIVPDLRYPNELHVCDCTVRMVRVDSNGNQIISEDRDKFANSETALDNAEFRYTIKAPENNLHLIQTEAFFHAALLNGDGHENTLIP